MRQTVCRCFTHLLYIGTFSPHARINLSGVIKVSDFGLTEDMYATNYYHKRKSDDTPEEKVPIRWMAPESIMTDVYTEKTDVVCPVASSIVLC